MPLPFRIDWPRLWRVLLTLLLAFGAAELCVWLHTPLPWMIGPLVATALATLAGVPTQSALSLRNMGQWTIGGALGLYFTPEVLHMLATLWWAVLLGAAWALLLGWLGSQGLWWMHRGRLAGVPDGALRSTAFYASSIGGASEMTLLAERAGARTDLVAAAHTVRVTVVVLVLPFAIQWSKQHWHLQAIDMAPAVDRFQPLGFALLALLTGAGVLAMRATRRPNPWFLGALLVAMLIAALDVQLSNVPRPLSNAAQLVIGISLGVRFTPAFAHGAPRWLLGSVLQTLALLAVSAVFAWLLALLTGLHPVTLLLATSPGGITEMAITAKVLQLGAPVVTAFQVCRLVAVLTLAEPLYRRWLKPDSGKN